MWKSGTQEKKTKGVNSGHERSSGFFFSIPEFLISTFNLFALDFPI
jgi:hypothetical protein